MDELTTEDQIFLSVPSVAYSGVQGTTKLWHIYILSLMTPQFVLGSHLNGIGGSPWSCQFAVDRKLAYVFPVIKKSKKEDPNNCGPLSLISVPGKIMEKMMLGVIEKPVKDNSVIGCSQHELMSGRSCLTLCPLMTRSPMK